MADHGEVKIGTTCSKCTLCLLCISVSMIVIVTFYPSESTSGNLSSIFGLEQKKTLISLKNASTGANSLQNISKIPVVSKHTGSINNDVKMIENISKDPDMVSAKETIIPEIHDLNSTINEISDKTLKHSNSSKPNNKLKNKPENKVKQNTNKASEMDNNPHESESITSNISNHDINLQPNDDTSIVKSTIKESSVQHDVTSTTLDESNNKHSSPLNNLKTENTNRDNNLTLNSTNNESYNNTDLCQVANSTASNEQSETQASSSISSSNRTWDPNKLFKPSNISNTTTIVNSSNIPIETNTPVVDNVQPTSEKDNKINSITNGKSAYRRTGFNLVFIGDSITRYQYLDFIYYLHTGKWVQKDEYPNLVNEKTFDSWIDFYNQTTNSMGGKETCDCYREFEWNVSKIFEVRIYSDSRKNNYVSYIEKFGHIPARGHWNPELAFTKNPQKGSPPIYAQSYIPPLWEYNWIDLVTNYVQHFKPKPEYAIFNAGLWPNEFHDIDILRALRASFFNANISTIYKTTTAREFESANYQQAPYDPYEIPACEMFDKCMNLSWTAALHGSDNYWESTHFLAHINQRINEQMLQLLET